jgi:chromosome partitioning protein
MEKCKIIAVANKKGGTGKTTTASNLGSALACEGKKVLLADFDPQANLTMSFGIEHPDELSLSMHKSTYIMDDRICLKNESYSVVKSRYHPQLY